MNDISQPINIELIQEHIIKTKTQLRELGKLYDLRESEGTHKRWGVKDRTINLPTFFHSLRESLIVKKGRLKK